MQTQTREILYWFGPRDLRPVPKFNSLYTTWQNNLCQICTTLLYTKKITTCTTLLITRKTLLYDSSLWMTTKYPISLETCMWSWVRFLIDGLSEFFTIELELCEEMKVETSFLKNRISTEFLGRKLVILIGVFIIGEHPYL